jgi:uncharacterized repeat protein (TIGR03803 family)
MPKAWIIAPVLLLSAASVTAAPVRAASYQVLYRFQGGAGGFNPNATLAEANGVLYGVTAQGGPGIGLAYALNPATGAFTVLHTFTGGTDGLTPNAGMIRAGRRLYGTTVQGGSERLDQGTVYALNPATGHDRILHAFTSGADGAQPNASLLDLQGMFYGTTLYGGQPNSLGTVFSIDRTFGAERVLHAFQGGNDGAGPYAALINLHGTLYGTTIYGGPGACNDGNGIGCGTVFAIDPQTGAETVIYRFKGGSDGFYPTGLTAIGDTIYGTSSAGGNFNAGCNSFGCGTVFAIDPKTGAKRTLHAFNGGSDGWLPYAGVTAAGTTLFGTTGAGGATTCSQGCGTVFSIDAKTGAEQVLYSFQGGSDGELPVAGLLYAGGTLYGATEFGGDAANDGTVFAITP